MPFNLDLNSILLGLLLGYFIFSCFALWKAYKQKKHAKEQLDKIEGNIKKIQADLEEKKKKLEDELRKQMGDK